MFAQILILTFVAYTAHGTSTVHGHTYEHASRSIHPSSFSGNGMKMRPVTSPSDGSTTKLNNGKDIFYSVNVTLGGSEFALQLDTGSADLVIFPDKPIKTSSVMEDAFVNSSYVKGWFAGPATTAKLELGGYTVESQVFLNATSVADVTAEQIESQGTRGILGVELTTYNSEIRNTLVSMYGPQRGEEASREVLQNVFGQHPDLDNFTVIALGRSDDGETTGDSYLGIGEYPEELKDLFANATLIQTVTPGDFNVVVDALTVDGKETSLNSSVRGIARGKAVATLDTGTSEAQVPKYVADAIYSGIPGAWYSDALSAYVVPCLPTATPNVTFAIGGREYYVNPLDLTSLNDQRPSANLTICLSTFTVASAVVAEQSSYDFLMGDIFLRNAYTSFYYGDFNNAANVTTAIKSPSVKLVSPSRGVDAEYSDYLTRRAQNLASFPPEATRAQAEQRIAAFVENNESSSATAAKDVSSGSSDSDSSRSLQALLDKLNAFAPIVFGLLGAIFIVLLSLLGVGIALCIRRGRTVGATRVPNPLYSPVPERFKEPEPEYRDEEQALYNQ